MGKRLDFRLAPGGDGFELPDQRTNKSFIRIFSGYAIEPTVLSERSRKLSGGRLVSEALMLLNPSRQSTRGQLGAKIY
jgi:hypothetical protein